MKPFASLALAGAIVLFAGMAAAETYSAGTVRIEDPWSRATPPGARAAIGFMTIENTGTDADRLVGGTSPAAGRVEIHEMTVVDNIMKMREVEGGLEIPAGGGVELAPGGYHVMFLDLPAGFVEGTRVPVTLRFEKAGEVAIEIPVLSIGAGAKMHMNMGAGMGGMGMGMGGMGMGGMGMGAMQGQK